MIDKTDKHTIDMFGHTALETIKNETMRKAKEKGTSCPCCGQFVKVYKRTINSTMARQMIHAYKQFGCDQWFHIRHMLMDGFSGPGDFSKLEHWGLVMSMPHVQGHEGKRTSGMWKITALGKQFIESQASVPQYAYIYNANLLEISGPEIYIEHALGKKFDYNELMGWTVSAHHNTSI